MLTRSGATWSQQAYVKASNTGSVDQLGGAIALAADGSTLAVGSRFESGGSTGINGAQADHFNFKHSGAVYVFARSGVTWSQRAYVSKRSPMSSPRRIGGIVPGRAAMVRAGTAIALAARPDTAAAGVG